MFIGNGNPIENEEILWGQATTNDELMLVVLVVGRVHTRWQ